MTKTWSVITSVLFAGSTFGAVQIERISVAYDGTDANGASGYPAISADGRYVAYQTTADNIVAGDTNQMQDIVWFDRQSRVARIVSVSSNGQLGNGPSQRPALSSDGRFVAFESRASNLVPGDTNGEKDIFVHDTAMHVTSRISVARNGTQADGYCLEARLSADGRYVAFYSDADNLVAGDTNGERDLFVVDRQSGARERVNLTAGGAQTDGVTAPNDFDRAAISGDGRYVVFNSFADNLGDPFGAFYLRDRVARTTTRLAPLGNDDRASIDRSGSVVAFPTLANLAGDNDGLADAAVWYRSSRSLRSASPNTAGSIHFPELSPDGGYIAYIEEGSDQLFLRDLAGASTSTLIVTADGQPPHSTFEPGGGPRILSAFPALSDYARVVAFESYIDNLVPGDDNEQLDVFVAVRPRFPEQLKINFQPASSSVPNGFRVDSGAVYGDRGNGFRYGWNVPTFMTRDRNSPLSPTQAYDTLNHMQSSANPNASWQISVPNGWYEVHVVCGDPSFIDGNFRVAVESVLTVQGRASSTRRWFEGTQRVLVSDGRLTVSNASGAANNKICFIEIAQVPSAVN